MERADSEETIPKMKTIGVIGGLGPQATIDFEDRLHRVCQKLIPQYWNEAYPSLFV